MIPTYGSSDLQLQFLDNNTPAVIINTSTNTTDRINITERMEEIENFFTIKPRLDDGIR